MQVLVDSIMPSIILAENVYLLASGINFPEKHTDTILKKFLQIFLEDQEHLFLGDIHKVSNLPEEKIKELIPDFEVLTGGFPCQPFSQAGKKLGFNDTRGTFFP